jgi:hypothetical protein
MYSSTNIVPGLVGRRFDGTKMSVLMVVDDFNFLRSLVGPNETNPITLVQPNAVLTRAIAFKRLEAISGRRAQIVQHARVQDDVEFSSR